MKNGFWFEGRRCKLEISEIGKKSTIPIPIQIPIPIPIPKPKPIPKPQEINFHRKQNIKSELAQFVRKG